MTYDETFDVIIIGGSYAGLAAGMALGRALRQVLIIDDGNPCNLQTPHSHNFITQDGKTPQEISVLATQQVQLYDTVKFFHGHARKGIKAKTGFEIQVASGESFRSKRVIFATGIRDILPDIHGLAACWGVSVLHCPFCHGYEVRNEPTGILGNGEYGFELAKLISNWTEHLTLYTNGQSALTTELTEKLEKRHIKIVQKEIARFNHTNGEVGNIVFKDGSESFVKAIYIRTPFEQHSWIPESLGCELTDDGYIKVDAFQATSVNGAFACGDNSARMRTVANAVSAGTTAGMMASKEIIFAEF